VIVKPPHGTPDDELDLQGARNSVEALVDELYSDADMLRQRDRIRERLAPARLAMPGSRVLAFPHRPAAVARRARPAIRWLAGSAAAGLLVGITAGHYLVPPFQTLDGRSVGRAGRSAQTAWTAARPYAASDAGHSQDEDFLVEMETVLNERRVAELRALDHLTPVSVTDRPRR
jgi:hypothetical protein